MRTRAHCAPIPRRQNDVLCVVEESLDVQAIERTRRFQGRYHVLGGALSPLDGIGPDELTLDSLLERVKDGAVREVIVATNPTVEGEATAAYIARLVKPLGLLCNTHCRRHPGGRRSRVRRRSHHGPGAGGPPRNLVS